MACASCSLTGAACARAATDDAATAPTTSATESAWRRPLRAVASRYMWPVPGLIELGESWVRSCHPTGSQFRQSPMFLRLGALRVSGQVPISHADTPPLVPEWVAALAPLRSSPES